MPKWWPFGRSMRADTDEPAAAVAPATVVTEPAWRRLPAIQRTVGDIESTTRLAEFNGALTTSQNPMVTESIELLAANGSDRLSVLDVASADGGSTSPPPDASPRTAPAARTFAPSRLQVQRAMLDSGAEAALMDDEPAAPHPVFHPVQWEDDRPSMVEAPSRDERRPLQVVDVLEARSAVPSRPSPIPAPEAQKPLQRNTTPPSPPTSSTPSTASSMVAVQRASAPPVATQTEEIQPERELPSPPPATPDRPTIDTPELPRFSSREPVLASPLTTKYDGPGSEPPPLRTLAPVQRSPTETVSSATRFGPSSPLAVLRAIDVAPSAPKAPPHASTGPVVAHHSTNPHVDGAVAHARSGPPPRSDSTPIQRDHVGGPAIPSSSPFVPTAEPPQHPLAHPHSATNARLSDAAAQRIAAPQSPDMPKPSSPIRSRTTVQRTADVIAPPRAEQGSRRTAQTIDHLVAEHPRALPESGSGPVEPEPVQRTELPVVPHASTADELHPAAGHRAGVATPVQRAATGGRLVVLPPLRSTSAAPNGAGAAPAAPARSVVAESTRPIGLQRMFDGAVRRASSDGSAGATQSRGVDDAPTGLAAVQNYGESGPHYDHVTNTITFGEPTIQRAPEHAAPEPPGPTEPPEPTQPPAVPVPPSTSLSMTPSTSPPEANVDELVNRLYDPLAARLRAELWQDRERAGVLMDLGR
jgi:hypothetical protein